MLLQALVLDIKTLSKLIMKTLSEIDYGLLIKANKWQVLEVFQFDIQLPELINF